MRNFSIVLGMVLGAVGLATAADVKGEEQEVGPVAADAKYIVSPHGVHLATVARKGSRLSVIVDGVAGPKFDDVITPTLPYVDPRPFEAEGRAAGTMAINVHPIGLVTFSRDGKRYAYVARLGQEWVLMVDNKEVLRLPVVSGAQPRLEFTGDEGKHFLFARSGFSGFELWVDGQKWPGFFGSGGGGTDGTIDPLTSPDGAHIAYLAQMDERGEKHALIVDGKDAGYYGTNLQFTADSKHLVSVARSPKGQAVLVDGKSLFTAKEIGEVYLSPVGNRMIVVMTHFSRDGNAREGQFLLVDGKPVDATLGEQIKNVIFSPDGKRYAAVCGKTGNRFVVVDGKKGQEYFEINETLPGLTQGMSFSPDSSKLAYVANATGKNFVVVNDEESDAFDLGAKYQFSPDGKRVAMMGRMNQVNLVILDGKVQRFGNDRVDDLVFSPDSSRWTCSLGNYLDGKATGLAGEPAFSPDSKHFTVVGSRSADNKRGLFVDGQLVGENDRPALNRAFTPDSQHLFWMSIEPAIGANAGPGIFEYVVYLDGKPAARCDNIANEQGTLRTLYGYMPVSWKTQPAWVVGPDGGLAFLGPVGDVVKRFTITPSASTGIAPMIAEAAAAPAKAAAEAAAAKKQAQDAAAARKAKADADAADAAAKAKADYDAAVAKRKADYDAAVAKRKADYDAAVAARAELLKQQQQRK